jgi:protein JSN1
MMDPYGRGSLNASPIAAPGAHVVQNGFAPPGFNPNVGMGGYQYPVGYYPQQQGQVGGGGQRRGRVSYDCSIGQTDANRTQR